MHAHFLIHYQKYVNAVALGAWDSCKCKVVLQSVLEPVPPYFAIPTQ